MSKKKGPSKPDLKSDRYDPTGRYEIKWVDGEVTCQCGAFVDGGMRPCNHIKWMKLRNRLPQMPRAQRDQVQETPEAPRQSSLAQAVLGDEKEQAKREPMVCFPLVEESSSFPMLLSQFLSGLKSVDIDYRKGGLFEDGVPSVTRRMEDIGDGVIRLYWSCINAHTRQPESGHIDLDSDKLIEHREWRMGKTQYTIMGAGGCLWIDGDRVICTTYDGDQMDVETWLAVRADRLPQ